MCGIVAYTGNREAYAILISGLKRLEYRGYDSAGVALWQNHTITLHKCRGKVSDLEEFCLSKDLNATTGIAHTRWATHGEPSNQNAHPHLSQDGKIALIHNGIIENYVSLKKELTNLGYQFQSNTDTEVLVHLIQEIAHTENVDLENAVRMALPLVEGRRAVAT